VAEDSVIFVAEDELVLALVANDDEEKAVLDADVVSKMDSVALGVVRNTHESELL
jgi:anti-anti-sigma regulatory factor